TSARPEQVEALFERTIPVGKQFGIVIVVVDGANFEVATFREDGPYVDGRRPASVHFSDARSDALRRDFTINAMFEDPLSGEIIDYVGGRADLASGVLRAVGDPRARFAEDRLRMIRAVRFATRFGFAIDPPTLAAVRAEPDRLAIVSAERIGEEVVRILTEGSAKAGFELLDETGLLAVVLPEITVMKGCEQSPDHHPEGDVFVHTMLCLSHLPPACTETLALGVLLHDIAKPLTAQVRDGRHTFYGHLERGAEMAGEICARLRRSRAVSERVQFLVAQHLRHCSAPDMRPATLKRFLRQDGIDELLELTRIDGLSSNGDLAYYEFFRNALADLGAEQARPTPLIDGNDLIELGMEPGPLFGLILDAIEDQQLEGTLTSRDQALEFVKIRWGSS
ncbi:MAG TPA: CCA tRNA nucleotidyltransferase, partial [Candidatus Binatia bacterium]|nr:CCA tRNA nucleotidyltransferase [Candidatus Binatia bacterium]